MQQDDGLLLYPINPKHFSYHIISSYPSVSALWGVHTLSPVALSSVTLSKADSSTASLEEFSTGRWGGNICLSSKML